MKCEYFNCNRRARVNLFDLVWLCEKHYLIVLDELSFKQEAGRPKKIEMSRIFRWLENKTYISLSDFMRDFDVTYPTASYYVRVLERYGFLEKTGNVWKVIKTGEKEDKGELVTWH
jgi:hypothetical protein